MKNFIASFVAVSMVAGIASAQITNGSFETGDFTGWTQFDNTGFTGVQTSFGAINPINGSFLAAFGPVGSTGGITQNIVANTGDFVTISFYTYNVGGTPNSFSADFDGSNLMNWTDAGIDQDWVFHIFYAQATSNNPSLTFTLQQDPSWILLDGVTVSVTPTPGAAAVLGLGGVAGLRRRRR